jgi:2-(1,2-epoxy-1,2-dihydrophenyl)acetyl-CoA isomerase
MKFECILFEVAEGLATITLNRPDKLNSFTSAMHDDLRHALDAVEKDNSVRCLLITGAGRGFCAGQDLSESVMSGDGQDADVGATLEKNYNVMVKRLRNLPIPVVCAVNGVAAGAGANFALVADIVIAARSASFIQAFTKIGLLPDCGGTYFLPRLVGTARTMGAAMLGEKISAERAEQWGLIWKCVDDADFIQESENLARHLANQATQGLALTKQAIYASSSNTLATQLDLERELQRIAGRTYDFREGVAAFNEKRPAKFRGN